MRERKDTNILTKNVSNVKYLSLFLSLVYKWSKEGISAGLGVYIFCWLHAVINLVGEMERIKCFIHINAYKIPQIYKPCISAAFH